jgi:iron complex outermembrane receptor protein
VTANRRSERLQDVPISVTAVTKDVLERQNVRDISDLTKLVPGLTINYGSQPGNFSINMRGIGTLSNGIAVESDVAVVIDDVPVGFQAAAFKDLIDVERIEALKGPQSTLFGKSAIAACSTSPRRRRPAHGRGAPPVWSPMTANGGWAARSPARSAIRSRCA